MADIYNTTNLSATNGLYQYATQVNILTDGWFAILMLFSFFVIVNIIFRQYDTKVVMLVACFSTLLIALFLFLISWVSITALFTTIAILAMSLIAQIWRTN